MNAAVVPRQNPLASNDGYHFKPNDHYIVGFQEMLTMQREGKFCDVNIVVGLETYRAHKLVLASFSKYFSDLFDDEDGTVEIQIDDISSAALESILQFLYAGEIIINVTNVKDILLACKMFKIKNLEAACAEAMPTLLSPTTWIQIKAVAGAFNSVELYQKCHKYALEHFPEIVETHQFLQLPFEEVKELIKDNELAVSSDEVVYSAVLEWVKYDLVNRSPSLYQLMVHVKLPLLDKTFFMKNVAREQLMRNNFECTTLLLEATEYHSGMHCDESSSRIKPRKLFQGRLQPREDSLEQRSYIFVTGGCRFSSGGFGDLSVCEIYDLRTDTWLLFSPMKDRRRNHGLTSFKGFLYAFGGYGGQNGDRLSSVECYDPLKNAWTITTSLPNANANCAVCATDNSIYICGGYNSGTLNNVYKFDPLTSVYMTSTPMKRKRFSFNLAVNDNCIYAIGGYDGRTLNSMEIFDPREGKWSDGPSISKPRFNHGVAVLDGYIYVSPVSTANPSWERFNIRRNKWEQFYVVFEEERQSNQVECCYIAGSSIDSIKIYDPKRNSEIRMPPMQKTRERFGATIMKCPEIKHST